jgi:carbonic anhydrase
MTDENWAYRNYLRWKKDYPMCAGKNQSPINIDTSRVADCNETCRLAARYKNSRCYVSNKNRTPLVRFDTGSFIKFKNTLYELKEMTLHTPSMHTINGEHYDMEIILYHYLNSTDKDAGGVAISVLLQRGSADSEANSFLSQFINQIPADEIDGERDISVSKRWNAEMLFPDVKSFFYYKGSLPMPPCKEVWTWIVFEETSVLDKTLYNNLAIIFKNNRRPPRALKSRTVFYNNSPKLDEEDKYRKLKIDTEIARLTKERNNIGKIQHRITDKDRERLNITNKNDLLHLQSAKRNNWFVQNKNTIKNILTSVILLLIVYTSIKMAKYLIRSGIITDYAETQIRLTQEKQMENAKLSGNQANFNTKLNNLSTGQQPINNLPQNNLNNAGTDVNNAMIRSQIRQS